MGYVNVETRTIRPILRKIGDNIVISLQSERKKIGDVRLHSKIRPIHYAYYDGGMGLRIIIFTSRAFGFNKKEVAEIDLLVMGRELDTSVAYGHKEANIYKGEIRVGQAVSKGYPPKKEDKIWPILKKILTKAAAEIKADFGFEEEVKIIGPEFKW